MGVCASCEAKGETEKDTSSYEEQRREEDKSLSDNVKAKIRKTDVWDDYEKVGHLGDGGFASVFKGQSYDTGELVAIKVMHRYIPLDSDAGTVREMNMHLEADHPNLVRMLGVYQLPGKPASIVLELFEKPIINGQELDTPDLMSVLMAQGALTVEESAKVIQQTALALEYINTKLHGMHRDLKPDNILVGKRGIDNIKVADYGQVFTCTPSAVVVSVQLPCGPFVCATWVVRSTSRPDEAHVWDF